MGVPSDEQTDEQNSPQPFCLRSVGPESIDLKRRLTAIWRHAGQVDSKLTRWLRAIAATQRQLQHTTFGLELNHSVSARVGTIDRHHYFAVQERSGSSNSDCLRIDVGSDLTRWWRGRVPSGSPFVIWRRGCGALRATGAIASGDGHNDDRYDGDKETTPLDDAYLGRGHSELWEPAGL